jgi:RNA polymerase sigma-54 factor
MEEPSNPEGASPSDQQSQDDIGEKDLVVDTDNNKVKDFERLDGLDDDYDDYMGRGEVFRRRTNPDEQDRKLEAINNTAAPPQSLHEHLAEQWQMVEDEDGVKKAGSAIIDYIDERGYLTVRLEQLYSKDRADFTLDDLKQALQLVQKLEPAGVGARDLRECLLIQMAQSSEDMSFEQRLVSEHMDELLENRLPDIARKMNCSVEEINRAIERMSKLDTSPGLQIGMDRNNPIRTTILFGRLIPVCRP